ncbi:macrolide family glycosyltransferase [Actinokineospora pegani]|uniref:macrolide family glycosyltransferase n=1 Tax=Actinokineospora pegani TaxID=2654637 RepID=UPI0018D354D0|nr:macrolide family glycosyltransferase [Actinokineospora pegani]
MASHIAIVNFPAYGHLNPTLGLVEELVRRGHRVTCTVTDHLAPAVEAAGGEAVRYTSVFGDFYTSPFTEEALSGEGLRTLAEATSLVEQVGEFYEANRPDVVLHDFMAWGARFFAAPRGIPLVRLFPTYAGNETFNIQAKFPVAELTDPKMMEMIEQLTALLPEVGFPDTGPMDFFMKPEHKSIVFLPREFHYDSETFDDRFVFAGPCLGDRSKYQGTWTAADDKPVVLVSLGTAATGRPEFFRTAVAALGTGEHRVVLVTGDHIDAAELGELPDSVEVHHSVPQLDVLSKASLFVTHGGMNSVLESLYHGVPMVVVPQMNEQRANALRVAELGLGAHLAPEDVTTESLAAAVAAVSGDAELRARTAEFGRSVRAVDGPAVAADAVEAHIAEHAGV